MIEIYIRNWIYNFYDKDNGPLYSVDEVNDLYQYQGTAGTIFCCIMMLLLAKITDMIGPSVLLTFGFAQKSLINFAIFCAPSPKNWMFYAFMPMVHWGYIYLAVQITSYAIQKYPKNVRGIMTNLLGICGSLGGVVFINIIQWVFNNYGFRSPFLAVCFIDAGVTVICVVMSLLGCITKTKGREEEEEADQNHQEGQQVPVTNH